jgi:hypothetical protein
MTNALVKRGTSTNTILLVALIALVAWLLLKKSQPVQAQQYLNAESWEINYNEDGMPTKIIVHRDAVQGIQGQVSK